MANEARVGGIEIEGGVIRVVRRLRAREPRVLGNGGELRHLEQRLQRSTDELRLAPLGDLVLVERLTADTVGEALHHQWAIGDTGQDERRDLDVVAKQIAFGDPQIFPERLCQVGHLDAVAVGQDELAVLPRRFEGVELIEDRIDCRCCTLRLRVGFG